MQQQVTEIIDIKSVCEKSASPCVRDTTSVEVPTLMFGVLRVSRCSAPDCGALFLRQAVTDTEMPLCVVARGEQALANICMSAFRIALYEEGRADEPISMGNSQPTTDL